MAKGYFKVLLIFIPLLSLVSAVAIPNTQDAVDEPEKEPHSGWSSGSTGWGWSQVQAAPIVGLAGITDIADLSPAAPVAQPAPIAYSSPSAPLPSGAPEAPDSPESPGAPSPGWAPGPPPAPQNGWGWKQN